MYALPTLYQDAVPETKYPQPSSAPISFHLQAFMQLRASSILRKGAENSQHEKAKEEARIAEAKDHDTDYVRMLKEGDQINWKYGVFANLANWVLLAGYLVIPGTFTSLKKSTQVEETLQKNNTGRAVLHTIQNPPLLFFACFFFLGGAIALFLLSRKLKSNYPWLINKVFM